MEFAVFGTLLLEAHEPPVVEFHDQIRGARLCGFTLYLGFTSSRPVGIRNQRRDMGRGMDSVKDCHPAFGARRAGREAGLWRASRVQQPCLHHNIVVSIFFSIPPI